MLGDDKQAGVIDGFNTTSRYLDDILNVNNVYLLMFILTYGKSNIPNLIKPIPLIPKSHF